MLTRSNLGGIGGQASVRTDLNCHSFGGTAVFGNVVYVPCTNGVRAIRINADATMTPLWQAPANVTGSPVIGGGRLWALDTGSVDMGPVKGFEWVKLVGIEGSTILVRGLDCIDHTPLIDLKPDRCEFTPLAAPQAGDFQTE